jgi:hypothetical protein
MGGGLLAVKSEGTLPAVASTSAQSLTDLAADKDIDPSDSRLRLAAPPAATPVPDEMGGVVRRGPETTPEAPGGEAPARAGAARKKKEETGYDSISEDELDDLIGGAEDENEDKQTGKIAFVDALDIKWETLIQTSSTPLKSRDRLSALGRFAPHEIFSCIGVSRAFAGAALYERLADTCQRELTAAEEEMERKEGEKKEEGNVEMKGEEPDESPSTDQTLVPSTSKLKIADQKAIENVEKNDDAAKNTDKPPIKTENAASASRIKIELKTEPMDTSGDVIDELVVLPNTAIPALESSADLAEKTPAGDGKLSNEGLIELTESNKLTETSLATKTVADNKATESEIDKQTEQESVFNKQTEVPNNKLTDTGKQAEAVDSETDTKPLDPVGEMTKFEPGRFELLDDIADFHVSAMKRARDRVDLVTNIGPHRRALCARRDLAIRRALCKVNKEDVVMFPIQVIDPDLYKQSLQLFRQDRNVVERKPATPQPPSRPIDSLAG